MTAARRVTPVSVVTTLPTHRPARQQGRPAATSAPTRMTAIDWKTELRKIEREFDGLPPEPSPAQLRAQRAAEAREKQERRERAERRGAWARLALVLVLAITIGFWPYARACGAGLMAYMSAEMMVLVGGIWVTLCTWRLRMGTLHMLAMGVALWGLLLIGHQILPRIGYPGTPIADASAWFCR